ARPHGPGGGGDSRSPPPRARRRPARRRGAVRRGPVRRAAARCGGLRTPRPTRRGGPPDAPGRGRGGRRMSAPPAIAWAPSSDRNSATGRRWLVGVVLVLLVGVAVAARLVAGQASSVPGHLDNPGEDGAMAVTRILGEHG